MDHGPHPCSIFPHDIHRICRRIPAVYDHGHIFLPCRFQLAYKPLLLYIMTFIIPVYENMPEIPVQSPAIDPNDYTKGHTKVYCNNSGKVNVRTGPSTSYEIITTVTYQDKMTRIQKGKQTGDRWDRVILENGIVGYIFQTYVTEMPDIQIESIELDIENTTLSKGETKQLRSNYSARRSKRP